MPKAINTPGPELAVVAPVYNEAENIDALYERVGEALDGNFTWQLILVDDGSRDGSGERLDALARRDARVRAVHLDRNRGQTTATVVGVRHADAPLVVTMDADLQTDPADILLLLRELHEHDAVVGYRRKREDNWLRRLSSRIANGVRNRLTGDAVRDTGCPLKLFRTSAFLALPLFEGMHRFLPTLLRWHGYSVVEHPVGHYPRARGESKYGVWNRLFRSSRDLFAVRWMRSRVIPGKLGEPTVGSSELPVSVLLPHPRQDAAARELPAKSRSVAQG